VRWWECKNEQLLSGRLAARGNHFTAIKFILKCAISFNRYIGNSSYKYWWTNSSLNCREPSYAGISAFFPGPISIINVKLLTWAGHIHLVSEFLWICRCEIKDFKKYWNWQSVWANAVNRSFHCFCILSQIVSNYLKVKYSVNNFLVMPVLLKDLQEVYQEINAGLYRIKLFQKIYCYNIFYFLWTFYVVRSLAIYYYR